MQVGHRRRRRPCPCLNNTVEQNHRAASGSDASTEGPRSRSAREFCHYRHPCEQRGRHLPPPHGILAAGLRMCGTALVRVLRRARCALAEALPADGTASGGTRRPQWRAHRCGLAASTRLLRLGRQHFALHPGRKSSGMPTRMLSERNQDRLEAEGGACITYTHFAYRFTENGKLNRRFRELMQRLQEKRMVCPGLDSVGSSRIRARPGEHRPGTTQRPGAALVDA
jgi:hypothetical protein